MLAAFFLLIVSIPGLFGQSSDASVAVLDETNSLMWKSLSPLSVSNSVSLLSHLIQVEDDFQLYNASAKIAVAVNADLTSADVNSVSSPVV